MKRLFSIRLEMIIKRWWSHRIVQHWSSALDAGAESTWRRGYIWSVLTVNHSKGLAPNVGTCPSDLFLGASNVAGRTLAEHCLPSCLHDMVWSCERKEHQLLGRIRSPCTRHVWWWKTCFGTSLGSDQMLGVEAAQCIWCELNHWDLIYNVQRQRTRDSNPCTERWRLCLVDRTWASDCPEFCENREPTTLFL